jgi:ion channel-forming bestrophin family protein
LVAEVTLHPSAVAAGGEYAMFVTYRGSLMALLRWQWKPALLFMSAAIVVVLAEKSELVEELKLSALPLAIVGGAIGIFVSFRTNSAYDRWWEGRKLWGQLVNVSRHFTSQVLAYLGADDRATRTAARALVRRHIGYVHVLRCVLRKQPPLADPEVTRFIGEDEQRVLRHESSMTHALLHRQLEELTALANRGVLDARRLQSLDESIRVALDVQGGCERIKNTPMPRGYGFIAERLIQIFGVLLPLALVDDLGWLTIPLSLVVCLAFTLINEVGRVLEDPFTMFWPALPLSALSRTIEINLRQRLGHGDLPPVLQPDDRGILM